MQGDVTVTTKNIMHGGLTPSKFICNCNGVFKRKSDFGSKPAKLLQCNIESKRGEVSHPLQKNFVCSFLTSLLPMTQHPLTDTKPVLLCRYLRDPDLRFVNVYRSNNHVSI